jgi:hypothetical protein
MVGFFEGTAQQGDDVEVRRRDERDPVTRDSIEVVVDVRSGWSTPTARTRRG